MLKIIKTILFPVILNVSLYAQNLNMEVYPGIGEGTGYAVKNVESGKLIAATINNKFTMLHIDDSNAIIDSSSFGNFSYTPVAAEFTSENNMIVLYATANGDSLDFYLAKLDNFMKLEWTFHVPVENLLAPYYYNRSGVNTLSMIIITANNDILFKAIQADQAKRDYIFKLNSAGALIWTAQLPKYVSFIVNPAIVELQSGKYVTSSKNYIYMLDQNGEIHWDYDIGSSVQVCTELSNGNIIAAMNSQLFIIDSSGNFVNEFELQSENKIINVVPLSDNGALVFNLMTGSYLTRYDNNFNVLWSAQIPLYIRGSVINNESVISVGDYDSKLGLIEYELSGFPDKYLFLLAPKGGESLPGPSNSYGPNKHIFITGRYSIRWASKNIESVSLEYSSNSGIDWHIIFGNYPANESNFLWNLPVIESDECLVKITAIDEPDIKDVSRNPFSISPYVSVDYIAGNEIKMWIGNNGLSAHDPYNDDSGFFWPGGDSASKSSVFSDGLLWGAKVNDDIRVNGATYRYGLTPGAILDNGLADDPLKNEYKMFKLKKDWESLPRGIEYTKYKYNYENWPGENGAPYIDIDEDGVFTRGVDKPQIIGVETLFYVANDLDAETTAYTYGSSPIGLEFQQTLFAYDTPDLKDAVFKKVNFINKSEEHIDSMYITYWTDDDMGYAGDDYVGVDTLLNLGYTYNGDNFDDDNYGEAPPAVGHQILQGPIVESHADTAFVSGEHRIGFRNLTLVSSNLFVGGSPVYRDCEFGNYAGTIQIYNNMQGLKWDATPYVDPLTGDKTKFCLPGDPVNGVGWFEGAGWPGGSSPNDRRYAISTGPFFMAPGDTQEVVYAIFMARGSDNINSVAKLKEKAIELHEFWNSGIATDVEETDIHIPEHFSLSQNYPNPFNPTTTIEYQIPTAVGDEIFSSPTAVKLVVFDILGREVETLVNEKQIPGKYWVKFDDSNYASGIYFYRLTAGDFAKTQKMILLK